MKNRLWTVLRWAAIVAGVSIYLAWAFSGEHEHSPHAALAVFIFLFWWQMNEKLEKIRNQLNEVQWQLKRSVGPIE